MVKQASPMRAEMVKLRAAHKAATKGLKPRATVRKARTRKIRVRG